MQNRLVLNATAFQYVDGPQILSNPVSTTSGYTNYYINALTTRKTGYELSLTATPVRTKDIHWDVLVNWSTFKDVFVELPPGQSTYAVYTNGSTLIRLHKLVTVYDKYYGTAFVKTTDGRIVFDASGYPLYNPAPQFLGNA